MNNRDKLKKSQGAFMQLMQQIPETKFKYVIYKNVPQGKISFTEDIGMDKLMYVQDKNFFNWKISPETDTIAGYPVQKATTEFAGRDYIAWFTNAIPIPEGPYKFNGLPGLILKIKDDKEHYVFELVGLQKLEKPIALAFDKEGVIQTNKEKLLEIKKEVERDPFAALERAGITIGYEGGGRAQLEKEHREQMKKENNPLELE